MPRQPTPEEENEIVELYQVSKLQIRFIAGRLGLSKPVVSAVLRSRGIATRKGYSQRYRGKEK